VQNLVPVYPMSLIWRADNQHPALTKLRHYLASRPQGPGSPDVWLPKSVTQPAGSPRH
jgi:hypothetical protein